MDREFLDHYNRELQLLYEHGREFAEEYPNIAARLGGLLAERTDPMISGLLEGAAFLAARVQLKLKHEFPEFSNNLLEQLVPQHLAPTPATLMAAVTPSYGDPALREGRTFSRGALFDATYRERDREVSCRFRLTAPITIWPFEIVGAQYFASASPMQALGLPTGPSVLSGLRVTLQHRGAARREDEVSDADAADDPMLHFAGCPTDQLTVQFVGNEADAVALYEQVMANRVSVHLRYLDRFGDPVVLAAPPDCVSQIGFDEAEALLPRNDRLFSGFDLLREYFTFPAKFLGMRLSGLRTLFARIPARQIDILLSFNELNVRLAAAVRPDSLALYAAPAVNLFEKALDRIPVRRREHEYHVIPDRSHYLNYETYRLIDVFAHYRGGREKVPVYPLYSATRDQLSQPDLCYTVRRLPRRRSEEERRRGFAPAYTGSDMFLTLVEPAGLDDERTVVELSMRALCSNRHLTEHMPVGRGGAAFRFLDSEIALDCIVGPTPPREPVMTHLRSRSETASTGTIAWRLINMLSLNHLGIVERGAGRNAQALREILSMFGDVSDSATERRIRGVRSVDSRPVVRRLRQAGGVGAARGIEITVTLDEKAFEGTGAFLLGAVLDRFFTEYASLNHFAQTVIRSLERGEIMRWPVRVGARRLS